jgi:hypothetical protein
VVEKRVDLEDAAPEIAPFFPDPLYQLLHAVLPLDDAAPDAIFPSVSISRTVHFTQAERRRAGFRRGYLQGIVFCGTIK